MVKSAQPQQGGGRLGALPADGWWSVAACLRADPELFFPVSGKCLDQVTEAKAICARCPARAECLAFALRTKQVHGVWGGLTEEERCQVAHQPANRVPGPWARQRLQRPHAGERPRPASVSCPPPEQGEPR